MIKHLRVAALAILIAFGSVLPSYAAPAKPVVVNPTTGTYRQIPATDTLQTSAATTANASLNVPPGVVPTTPVNGDIWSTSGGLFMRVAGVTVPLSGGVTSFNTRTGAVTLTSGDVTGALTYTPLAPANNLSDVSSVSTARSNLGLGTFATANAATPPAIGGTTPAPGTFSSLKDTGVTGSTQCVQADTTGLFSGTGAACGAGGGGASGSLILLEQHAASSSAALNFTTCISSTYEQYSIELIGLVPATSSSLYVQLSTDGGSTYSATTYSFTQLIYAIDVSFGQNTQGPTSGLMVANSVSTNASYGVDATAKLFAPGSSRFKKMNVEMTFNAGDAHNYGGFNRSIWATTTAANAFRVLFSSGNIASGTVRCYGIAK